MAIEPSFCLSRYNALRLSSRAQWFAQVESLESLHDCLNWATARQLGVLPLGEGSNVILQAHLNGLILKVALKGILLLRDDGGQVRLRVAAGENWHDFVAWCVEQGCYGLENLALIPGSVGAAPVQNIGAYGVEVADCIVGVQAIDVMTGKVVYLSAEDCQFSYRSSVFKQNQGRSLIITAVDFQLNRDAPVNTTYPTLKDALLKSAVNKDAPNHQDVFDAVIKVRSQRLPDPTRTPNVGSFFKNPLVSQSVATRLHGEFPGLPQYETDSALIKLSAAWMIDQLGWRGKELKGVAVSEAHSLVLVNRAAHSSTAVLGLSAAIQQSVLARFGVELALEPEILGSPEDRSK